VELLLSNRDRLLMGVASAHFSLFSKTNARHSKERWHVVEALTSRCQCFTAECQPESVTDANGQNKLRKRHGMDK
jgi:hypothetical protein